MKNQQQTPLIELSRFSPYFSIFFIAIVFLVLLSSPNAHSAPLYPSPKSLEQLVGSWHFDFYTIDEHVLPRPNPQLHITYKFYPWGINSLYWERENETGHCHRMAYFKVIGNTIKETIFWSDPDNNPDCFQDPDMQEGKQSLIVFQIVNDNTLKTQVLVGDKEIWYIWSKVVKVSASQW